MPRNANDHPNGMAIMSCPARKHEELQHYAPGSLKSGQRIDKSNINFLCLSGNEVQACSMMAEHGFKNVKNFSGNE